MKRSTVLIIVAMLLFPTVAYANGPALCPYDARIAVDGCSKICSLSLLLSEDGVEYGEVEALQDGWETRRRDEKIFSYVNKDGRYKSFKLEAILKDGTAQISNAIEFGHSYLYDVESNVLEQGAITSGKLSSLTIVMLFLLGLPFLIALMVEWGISQAFRLKPGRYVVLINLLTNPVMNILILVLYENFMVDYSVILILLELFAGALEFWFYTFKYKQYSKKRLVAFTLTANAIGWGIYYFFGSAFFIILNNWRV